jgi:hypothetical protein
MNATLKKELVHSGMDWWSAWKKKRKMEIADIWTKSGSRGFRVINYTGSEGSRSDIARSEPADCFVKFFQNSETRIRNAKTTIDRLLQVVDQYENFVFIASSLLFCYGTESKQVRVKLIDFAHSYNELNERHSRIRYPPMDCTVRLRGDRCPTKSDLEIGIE